MCSRYSGSSPSSAASAAGAYYFLFVRSRNPQVELYFDDGSMLAFPGNTDEAEPFVAAATEILAQSPLAALISRRRHDERRDFTGPDPGLLDAVVSDRRARGRATRPRSSWRTGRSLSLRLEDGKIEDAVSGVDRGGSVRVIRGLSTEFGYVDAVDEPSLLRPCRRTGRGRAPMRPASAAPRCTPVSSVVRQ